MVDPEVQAQLDRVAEELGAGISLGDVDDLLVAHSVHDGLIDEVRQTAMMRQRLAQERLSWFEQWGIREATRPVRTPASESLGALERWCVPVRYRGMHFGYIWVLDAGAIAETDLQPAIEAASEIGARLYQERLAAQVDADLLRLLLIPPADRERFAPEAQALRTHKHKGPVAIVVAGASHEDELSPSALSDLALAVKRAAARAPAEGVLSGMISGYGVLLAPLGDRRDRASAQRLAADVRKLASEINGELEIVAGIGGVTKVESASQSYAEAQRALRMARMVSDLGPIASWDDLGIFRALALVPTAELETGVLDPRVKELLSDAGLAGTAETFLDLAGNVQKTAAQLYLHRTTLYQRLDRITALYGLDLRQNGGHRLMTHLGLKLARLAGPE